MTDQDLERALARLPEPGPPVGFAATVMSAIAAEAAASAAPQPATAAVAQRTAGPVATVAFVGGVTGASLAAAAYTAAMVQRGWTEVAAPLVARADLALHRLPPPDILSLVTALGLIVLLAATLIPSPARRAG